MSSNGIVTTVVGWAATAPREIHAGKVPYTSFRLATTPRHYDRRQQVWVEGRTEWITVKAFRSTALNVALSIRKGEPVLVSGRLATEEWQGENGPRFGLVLEATAIGHDLTRGRATFVKTAHLAPGEGEREDDGPDDAPRVAEAVAAELAALAGDEDAVDQAIEDLARDLVADLDDAEDEEDAEDAEPARAR